MKQSAVFIDRTACIACGSSDMQEIAAGRFSDEPLRGILAAEEWGVEPLPLVEHESWSFVKCRSCDQAFHRRILAPDWITRLYTDWESQEAMERFLANLDRPEYPYEIGVYAIRHALRLHKMTKPLRGRTLPRLLDFGCGWGEFVSQCNALGFDAVGVDFAPDRQEHAKVKVFPSLEAVLATQDAAASFHAVTMFQVLEHLVEPREVLEQVAALMAPGGVLILETPDVTGVTGIQSRQDYLAIGPLGHINGFTPTSLCALAKAVGFKPVRPAPVWLSTSWTKLIKATGRAVLNPVLPRTTNQYFRRCES
jgi:SAM-dependent methyltransferase